MERSEIAVACDKEETRLQDTQQRGFGDSGPEYGQEWKSQKSPWTTVPVTQAFDSSAITAILIRFFSTKEKDLEKRAVRSVYVSEFSATKETYEEARYEDITI